MAKSTNKGGTSRVRFIMLEAEGPEGDLAQIAQAIQNALRPPQGTVQRVISAPSVVSGALPSPDGEVFDGDTDEAEDVSANGADAGPQKIRKPRQRKTTVPQAYEFTSEAVASWKEFAGDTAVSNDTDRYLTVAAWMHDHHNNDPVTVGHVYSCFRIMKWSVDIPDFGSPLRQAKKRQYLNSAGRAAYTITQLGLQRIEDLRKA